MRVHKKIGTKERLIEIFENVNKIKINEAFDSNKTLSVKDWNEFSDGSIELTFSDNRIESFNYYDEEDNGALDYHISAQDGDGVGVLLYINDDNTLIAKFEAITPTNNPDNPEWEINNILEVEPFQQQTNESTSQSYSDQTGIKRAIMLDSEFSQLVDPQRTAFIADPKTKIFSTGTALVFTDGKREFVVSKNRPMNVLKGVSNARAIIKDVYNNSLESPEPLKEDVNNEVGTDSGIFQMLFAYVTKNRITEVEFQVGELTVQIIANPTTWDDIPYRSATHMQPEEGGYPENVQGEISDIVIWDKEDNEYTLSSDALQRLNQNVQFDGNALEDITEKAANGGEDEYSRADFARKDNLENEGVIKEDNVNDITRDYIDNIEGLSPERKAELIARQTAPQDNSPQNVEYTRMHTNNGLRGEEPKNRKERRSAGIGGDFSKNVKDKLKEDETNETSYTDLTKKTGAVDMMEGIRFNYDQKGNWIPEGYEDKRIALRPLEQPFGSDNWKVALVTLDANGDLDDIVKVTDTWEEGKNALYASVN